MNIAMISWTLNTFKKSKDMLLIIIQTLSRKLNYGTASLKGAA